MNIVVQCRNNKIYPVCSLAYAFYELMNGGNFTSQSIEIIKSMGYQFIDTNGEKIS